MWNRTNSSIKFLDFSDAALPNGLFFARDLAVSSSQIQGEGFSKLDHEFAMTFLDNKIWQDLTAKVEQSVPCNSPFIAISFKEFVSGFFKRSGTSSLERFLKPVEKANIGIGNFKDTAVMAIFVAVSWFVLKFTSIKTAFSVDNARKICEMQWIMDCRNVKILMFKIFVDKLFHIASKVNKFINQYTHEVYLSPG